MPHSLSAWAGSVVRAVRQYRHVAMLGMLLAGFSLLAMGQEATIVGTVTDPSGSVVPNVAVTVTHVETGETRSATSNDTGQFVAPDLPIGHYNVNAKASGFGPAEKDGIVLNVNDRTRVDFVLKVGTAQENVTVEANAVQVQSDSGEVSTVISGEQVAELGVNGRSVYSLYNLTPGASSLQGDLIIPAPVSGDSTVSINGQRAGHNLQLLDGSENLDRGGSSASVMPSMDAIAEFRDLTSNYSAEYGLSGAAMITTVIKSGTKQFHASAWEFFRNDALDARNFFNPAPAKVAELRFNVFGFNAGGQVPIAKNHPTFFFYNMEWRRLVQGGLTNQTVPLASAYPDANGAGTGAVIPTTLSNGNTDLITAPSTTQLSPAVWAARTAGCPAGAAPAQGAPFANNTIPDCLIDPNALALLNAGIFPKPTSGAQFIGGNNSPTNIKEEIARVDHQFTDKFSVFGHWVSEQVSQTYGTTQWSGDNVPTISDVFGNPSYAAVVHTTYVISPTLLNEAAFNYNGNRINIIPQGVFQAPSAFTFSRLFTGPNADNRIPAINLNGSTGTNYTSNWTPWINKADDYQLRDDISWTKGAHQLKFGFSWALYKKIQDYFADTEGQFQFNGSFTTPTGCTGSNTLACGNDFADFLLGFASQYQEDAVKSSGHWNNVSLASYVQDNWRVTHRLTLNLGLRWDAAPHTYEANQQSSNFYPNLYNPANAAVINTVNGSICTTVDAASGCPTATPAGAFGASPNPILAGIPFYLNGIGIGGKNGIPKGLAKGGWLDFGPRIGFAYDLTGQGKTVVRGGFGIMYDRVQGNDMYNGATNPPFDASATLHSAALSNVGLNVGNNSTISAAALPVLPVGITGIASDYPAPTSYQYSAGIQQALNARSVLSLSYVGSIGRNENDYREINLPPITSIPALLGNVPNTPKPNINTLYNYAGYSGIRLSFDEGQAHYNSFQVDLRSTLHNDLTLQFGYTYAKAIDATTSNGSGGDLNNVTNPYVGWKYDQGYSVYDRRNVAFVNFVYNIPLLKNSENHLLKAVAGGWALEGIITAESGAPLNMGVNGSNAASVIPNSSNRPNYTGSIGYPKNPGQWFNPADFSAPVCATGPDCYGNLPFGAVRGPGRDNWNMSLFKNFVINAERGTRVEFRAESYNTWNHTQFKGDFNNGGISTNVGSSNFGAVTAAFDPRVFQLGLKVIY